MPKSQRLVLLVLVPGLAALILWLLVRPAGREEPSAAAGGPLAAAPAVAAGTAAALPPAAGERGREEIQPEPPPAPGPPQSDPLRPRLDILVLNQATGEPVAGVTLELWSDAVFDKERRFLRWMEEQGWGKFDEAGEVFVLESFDAWPVTQVDGRTTVYPPADIPFSLSSQSSANVGGAELEVGSLAAGERREVVLRVPVGLDLVFHGRLVDARDGRPVARADLALDEGSGERRPVPVDPSGMFHVVVRSWELNCVEVEAEGYGKLLVVPEAGHETPETALSVPLVPAAHLSGRVTDAAGPAVGAWVQLAADPRDLARPEHAAPALFGRDGPVAEWGARAAPDGGYAIGDLPPGVPLRVAVTREGRQPVRMPEPVLLAPGEARELDLDLGVCATVRGRVVDQSDAPVPEVRVVAREATGHVPEVQVAQQLLMGWERGDAAQEALTDADGRFTLQDLMPGRWLVGLSPPLGKSYSVSASGQVIEMPVGQHEVLLTLRVYRGLFLRGRVVGPNGEAVGCASVHAMGMDVPGFLYELCRKDGSFELGPLVPGRFRLQAETHPDYGYADSEPVVASPGEGEIVLRLRPCGALRGRLRGLPDAGDTVVGISRRGDDVQRLVGCDEDGGFADRGLVPGVYDVCASSAGGFVGAVCGVQVHPDAETPEVILDMEPGGVLELRASPGSDIVRCTLRSGSCFHWLVGLASGSSHPIGVPAGPVAIEHQSIGGELSTRHVHVAVGQRLEVVLGPE